MKKHIIGLMSGTSLDALDIVYVGFDTDNLQDFQILASESIPYTRDWQYKLQAAFRLSADDLAHLDVELGKYFGEHVNRFIEKYDIKQVDLIASHGQTIFHRPEKGYTTQIGSGAHINALTKIKTICDFRTQDVAIGGQGAPLVPIGDRLLFAQYDYCLNIGGFANISFEKDQVRMAYDICPANIVLNTYVIKLGHIYDEDGKIARKGKIHPALLNDLNSLEFYKDEHPKSLGWEYVMEHILPLIDKYGLDIPDVLRTYTEHVAIQIGNKTDSGTMLITGGGAYHSLLVERIKHHTEAEVIIPAKELIDFKEALIFALLGLLKDERKINILSSVTGSPVDHSSGVIFDAFSR